MCFFALWVIVHVLAVCWTLCIQCIQHSLVIPKNMHCHYTHFIPTQNNQYIYTNSNAIQKTPQNPWHVQQHISQQKIFQNEDSQHNFYIHLFSLLLSGNLFHSKSKVQKRSFFQMGFHLRLWSSNPRGLHGFTKTAKTKRYQQCLLKGIMEKFGFIHIYLLI